jgi:hypothetical protein
MDYILQANTTEIQRVDRSEDETLYLDNDFIWKGQCIKTCGPLRIHTVTGIIMMSRQQETTSNFNYHVVSLNVAATTTDNTTGSETTTTATTTPPLNMMTKGLEMRHGMSSKIFSLY